MSENTSSQGVDENIFQEGSPKVEFLPIPEFIARCADVTPTP